ncbi:prepilin peptidase [Brevundimonas sp. UBA7534]|uniref:prepilin peptidase n=1 Tax=Brevundimonas sp. UBA7534 TaxID=1946138 RepID=UPI0025BE937E|nr:A24 family peptidase [Brevundimonas sp. UBA7534]
MTSVLIVAVLGGLGLIFGSFIGAVSVRLPRDMDVVTQRSRCMTCEATLRPWELVPVFSWLALRGRCARCDSRISPRYPLIELGAAAVGVWAAWAAPDSATAIATAALGWQLLLIALVDGEHFWLPDALTWPLAASGVLAAGALHGWSGAGWSVFSLVVGFGVLWGVAWLYRRVRGRDGLGGGDPFLFAGAGAWVGWIGLPSVLLWACAAGLSVVVAQLVVRRRVSGGDRLPFGVFLAIGIWLTWLYGPLGL